MFILQCKKRVSGSLLFCAFAALFFLSCATSKMTAALSERGVTGVSMVSEDEGFLIKLEEGDILFEKDSMLLLESEDSKLRKIIEVLNVFNNRSILFKGYTAFSGTKEGRRYVSNRRASALADYLVKEGVISRDCIFIKAFGAENPVGSNKTEDGRAKNRRVEVLVLTAGYKSEVQREIASADIRSVNAVGGIDGTMIRAGKFDTRFSGDSTNINDCETIKLDRISDAIALFEDNYVMVRGHSAFSGKRSRQWAISAKRAQAVAEYIVKLGVKSKDRIIIKACGADEPIATNKTEEGKVKNRRVEIIILDLNYDEFEDNFDLGDFDDDGEVIYEENEY